MMQKRLIGLMLALVAALCFTSALAENGDASALNWEELTAWAESYKERAMTATVLNDPTADAASSEDGYMFIYDFATLYMDRPEMTDEAQVRSVVVTDADEIAPHGTTIDMRAQDVLGAYYNENENLEGNRSFATLYVSDMMPDSAAWAWVQRDGQRVMTIQYAVHEQLATGGDGYTDAGLIYTMQDGLVAAIRAYGLEERITADEVKQNLADVNRVAEERYYAQVPTSTVGTDLDPFEEDDLSFSGIHYLSMTPEEAEQELGQAREDTWMQDDNGTHLRSMEFADCSMTFVYDEKKSNPYLDMLIIDMDGMEGPRCVRVGDTLTSVLTRFRHGEGSYDEAAGRETLYGMVGSAPYGVAEYGGDAPAMLMYVLACNSKTVCLHMTFEQMLLTEITLYNMD